MLNTFVSNGRAYKSNTYLKFEETLYMDRFLPSADPTKRERTKKLMKELMKAREKLSVLQDSKVSFHLHDK